MRGNSQNPPTSADAPISSAKKDLHENSIPLTTANIHLNPLICGLPSGLRKEETQASELPVDLVELISVWRRLPEALRQSWLLTARMLTGGGAPVIDK